VLKAGLCWAGLGCLAAAKDYYLVYIRYLSEQIRILLEVMLLGLLFSNQRFNVLSTASTACASLQCLNIELISAAAILEETSRDLTSGVSFFIGSFQALEDLTSELE
jgi:hypothetical protein